VADALCNSGSLFADCAAHFLSQQTLLRKLFPGSNRAVGYVDNMAP
jgi:hypothetical protein